MTPITITKPQKSKIPRMCSGKVAIRENCKDRMKSVLLTRICTNAELQFPLSRCSDSYSPYTVERLSASCKPETEPKAELNIRKKETSSPEKTWFTVKYNGTENMTLLAGKGNLWYNPNQKYQTRHYYSKYISFLWLSFEDGRSLLTRFSSARQSSMRTITWNSLWNTKNQEVTKFKTSKNNDDSKRQPTWYEQPMQQSQSGMSLSKQQFLLSAEPERSHSTSARQTHLQHDASQHFYTIILQTFVQPLFPKRLARCVKCKW